MHDPDELIVVWQAASERESAELALVLTARGIEHRRVFGPRGELLIAVRAADAQRATAELAEYRSEHSGPAPAQRPLPDFPGAWIGVAVYAAVLMLVATLTEQGAAGIDWRRAGALIAGRIFDGEWWRAVTALTLHADTAHLASNLGFGAFFGYFIGRYFGPGVGWLAILCAGASGNFLNALIQSAEHRSIGASTAVFGALGLLTAHAWARGPGRGTWRARLAPIGAGIALLAFTGTGGENTDIFAHLTGFVAGFAAGAVLSRVEVPASARVQVIAGIGACALLVVAWALALAAAS